MELFLATEPQNLLPRDGEVLYKNNFLNVEDADRFLDLFTTGIQWKHDQARIYGKLITTKRKVAWYGDEEYEYIYSGVSKRALPWTEDLLEIKRQLESHTGVAYNSCLLNYYHNGEEGMAWHSDAEKVLKRDGSIASISLGAVRKFYFRHKISGETVSLLLEHGSLLLMQGCTQTYWQHRLPPSKKVMHPRINLTFRIYEG